MTTPDGGTPGRLPLPPELSPRRRGKSASAPRVARRRSPWGRMVSGTAVLLSVVVLATSAFAYGYFRQLNGNINRANVFSAIQGHRPAKISDGAQNILLVGSDSRVGATAAQLAAANTTQDGGGTNTDTLILLHIPAGNGQVTMVSFPRDSWVAIPGHNMFKINAAYQDGESAHKGGGPALLVQTIENLAGIRIDHYIQVNFFQFIDITNAIGGVQVCLTQPAKEKDSGINLPAGVQTIKGSQALAFVRQRKGLAGGDFSRIQRQQRFASAVVHKAKSIRNPATLNALLQQVTQSLTVDSGESAQNLLALANRLKNVDPANIHFTTIPTVDHGANHLPPGYQSEINYVTVDPAAVQQFMANIEAGRDPNAPASQPVDTASPVAPGQVHVQVLNGSGVAGKAGSTRDALTPFGFVVDSIGNAPATDQTTIRYGSAEAGAAHELSKAVRGAKLVPDASLGSTVELVVGASGGSVSDPASTPPSTAPSSSPPPSTSPAPSGGGGTAAGPVCGP
ncbi:MAG TPA: LCP family protein [Mycobacteriales bacterium]|nr:LCP family protein [Mycobacteriales bacterium]